MPAVAMPAVAMPAVALPAVALPAVSGHSHADIFLPGLSHCSVSGVVPINYTSCRKYSVNGGTDTVVTYQEYMSHGLIPSCECTGRIWVLAGFIAAAQSACEDCEFEFWLGTGLGQQEWGGA